MEGVGGRVAKNKHIKRSIRQHALWAAANRSRLSRFFREFASLVFIDYATKYKHDQDCWYAYSVKVGEDADTGEMRVSCILDVPSSYIGGQ